MFLIALLPKIANEQLQEWKLKLVTDLGSLAGTSPVCQRQTRSCQIQAE